MKVGEGCCLLSVTGTMWTFVLLGLAFVCLLIGFLLLGMGTMASKYELPPTSVMYNILHV